MIAHSIGGRREMRAFDAGLPLTLAVGVAGTLLSVSWPEAGIAVVGSSLVGVGLLRLDLLLALLVLSVPLQGIASVSVWSGDVTATQLVVGAVVIAWAMHLIRGRVSVLLGPVAWAYFAVFVALVLSFVNAVDRAAWVGEVYRWGISAVVFLIAASILHEAVARRLVIASIAAGVLGTSIYGLVQLATGDGPASYQVDGLLRIYATFGAPNPLAAYLELGLPLLLALTLRSPATLADQRWLWWCSLGAALIGTMALILTQSRGGILGFAAALAVLVLGAGRRVCLTTLLILGLIMTMLLTPLGGSLGVRFVSAVPAGRSDVQVTSEAWANQERLAHWGAGLRMMREYPMAGVGAGQFDARFREFTPTWRFRVPRGHAHNGYIQMGAQAGVLGMVAMTAFTIIVLASVLRVALRERSEIERAVRLGALAVVVAFSVHSMVDYLNVLSLGIQLAVVIALATIGNTAVNTSTSFTADGGSRTPAAG